MIEIEFLSWDTKTFGFKVGNLIYSEEFDVKQLQKTVLKAQEEGYKLLYLKDQCVSDDFLSDSFLLVDKKVIYSKLICKCSLNPMVNNSGEIVSVLNQPLQMDLLLLALQSGGFSRYYMDKIMPIHVYLSLYNAWINNSLDGSIASDVLAYQEHGKNVGLLTYKKNDSTVTIGLIAVNNNFRDKGIGSKLLNRLFSLFPEEEITIEVATQHRNYVACQFYEKNGFQMKSIQKIYHIWVNDYCEIFKHKQK